MNVEYVLFLLSMFLLLLVPVIFLATWLGMLKEKYGSLSDAVIINITYRFPYLGASLIIFKIGLLSGLKPKDMFLLAMAAARAIRAVKRERSSNEKE